MSVLKYCVFVRLFEFETKRDGWWWLNFFFSAGGWVFYLFMWRCSFKHRFGERREHIYA